MSEVASRADQPICAGCGMHFSPIGRPRTATAPGSTVDAPVCSRACQETVTRFGALPGWQP